MKLKTFISWIALAALVTGCNHLTTQKPPGEPPPVEAPPEPEPVVEEPEVVEVVEPEIPVVPPDTTTRVALLLPLSGRHSGIGQSLLNAAQMALFDAGAQDFELIIGDTAGDAFAAEAAAQDALAQGASLILGPLFSASLTKVAEVARFQSVPVVSFSNNTSLAEPGIHVMGLAPEMQVSRVVSFAISQGHLIFALLAPNNAYGDLVTGAFQDAVFNGGAEVHAVTLYPPGADDISAEIQGLANYLERAEDLEEERLRLETEGDEASLAALEALENNDTLGPPPFDALLLPQGGRELLTVAPLMNFYDVDAVDVRFLGTAQWEDESLTREPSLQSGWFVAPDPMLWQSFAERYRGLYKEEPLRLSTLAYDATALAVVLARQQADDFTPGGPYGGDTLIDSNGFAGIDGTFRFLPDGRIERGLAILEMSEEGFQIVDPAPDTFEDGGF